MGFIVADQAAPPFWVLMFFLAWGVLMWFVWGRDMLRNPRGEFRKMAEKRARSRTVRLLGGSGDPDKEFDELWRTRWLWPVIAVFYVLGLLWFFTLALFP